MIRHSSSIASILLIGGISISCGKPSTTSSSLHSVTHEKQFFLIQGERLMHTECPEGRVPVRENCFDAVPESRRRSYRVFDVKSQVAQTITSEKAGFDVKKKALIDEARELDEDIKTLDFAVKELRSKVGSQFAVVEEAKHEEKLAKAKVLLDERDLADYAAEIARVEAKIKEVGSTKDLVTLKNHLLLEQAETTKRYEEDKLAAATALAVVTAANNELTKLNEQLKNAESGASIARARFYPKPSYARFGELQGYETNILRLTTLETVVSKRVYEYMEEAGVNYRSELLDEADRNFIKDYFFPLTQRCRRLN